MKIAINTRFLIPGKIEGIGRYTYELARRLVEGHPEHQFLFFFDRPYDTRFLFGANVQPVVLSPPARHPFLWYLWFEFSLPRALRRYQPDVFFSPDGYLSLRSDTPTVMTVHDLAHEHYPQQVPFWVSHFYSHFVPRYCRRAESLLAVSEYTKKDIHQRYGTALSKIKVCGNGCRPGFEPFSEEAIRAVRQEYTQEQPYFLYVGAVHPRKNTHRLIEAFSRFKKRSQSPAQLLIAGRFAWQTGEVKTAYEASTYQQDIHFLGYVEDEKLPRLMGGALCFVYPSLFEGFGLPLLEAMHCDVPLITSLSSSMPEVAGKAARLVDPLITDQIAIAMQEIADNPALRRQLIEEGRKQRQKFSWEKTAEVVYGKLLHVARGS